MLSGSSDRAALTTAIQQIRRRMEPHPVLGVPTLDSLDEAMQDELRTISGGRLGCVVAVVRYQVIETEERGPPPPGLALAVLAHGVEALRAHVRAADLFLARLPDTVVVLAPGGEPLAGRAVVTRLSVLLGRHRDRLSGVDLEIIPAWGSAFRASTPFARWDLAAIVNEARGRATVQGGPVTR